MIVVQVSDPTLRYAVGRAAHVEEDVVWDAPLVERAMAWGAPRLVVVDEVARPPARGAAPILRLSDAMLRRWESERRDRQLLTTRLDFLTRRVAPLIERPATETTWVDRALADLSRAAGAGLPVALRSFSRRVFELPVHYVSLQEIAAACSLSPGALKAKFRRRGLASPYTYLRWLRILAVADRLSDRADTIAAVALWAGFTSGGNLCRTMSSLCAMTPSEARTVHGWNKLLLGFAWRHLRPPALEAWSDLESLFERRVA